MSLYRTLTTANARLDNVGIDFSNFKNLITFLKQVVNVLVNNQQNELVSTTQTKH